jgi:shikimate kinase
MKTSNITLIGMSNVGKSHWRKELEQLGFTPFWCDNEIEMRLEAHVKESSIHGIEDMSRWMGQPYEPQYQKNEARYLSEETAVIKEAIRSLRHAQHTYVVDTTGSVIYLDKQLLRNLKEVSTIVLLDAPDDVQEELHQKYLENPKPVIWGNAFQPLAGEKPDETVARCYPLLLKSRNKKYREIADIVLDYHELRKEGFNVQNFLGKLGIR